jgi:hypothetical protein
VSSRLGWGALAVLLLLAPPARSDDSLPLSTLEPLALSGSLRAGYWSSDRDLNDRHNFTPMSLWLKSTPDLGGGWRLRAEGWVDDDRPLEGESPKAELREALVSWHGDELDFSVGRRIVAWGRADRINPTDVISSRDFTRLFTEDADQRRGNLMATAARSFGDLTATFYWLPEHRPNVYPIAAPDGVTVLDQEGGFDARQFAVRLDQVGRGFDWSISYFDGLDRDPDGRIDAIDAAGMVTVRPIYRRARALGADFATTVGRFGLRGEVAYRQAAGHSDANFFNKGDVFAAVIGVDRDISDSINVNVQYLLHHVIDYDDPRDIPDPDLRLLTEKAALVDNQLTRTQQGVSFRLAYTGLNDTLSVELAAVGYFSDESAALRPKVSYALTDALKIIGGVDLFFGDSESLFGDLRKNRTAYVELRYGF